MSQGIRSAIQSVRWEALLVLGVALSPAVFASEGDHFAPTIHPGFENGVLLGGGIVQSSLAAEDIDEDGVQDLVVGGNEGVLYAFRGDGSPVLDQNVGKGLPIPAAIGQLFAPGDGAPILSSPTLADVNVDRRMDVFFGNDDGKVFRLRVILSTDEGDFRKGDSPTFKSTGPRVPRDLRSTDPEEADDSRGR